MNPGIVILTEFAAGLIRAGCRLKVKTEIFNVKDGDFDLLALTLEFDIPDKHNKDK